MHVHCFPFSSDCLYLEPSDIINTLVSIYDSRDLFIKELQVLLAQRLLSHQGWCRPGRKGGVYGPEIYAKLR